MNKDGVTFIIVQSVKGGAGKSTVALSLAVTLDVMQKLEDREEKIKQQGVQNPALGIIDDEGAPDDLKKSGDKAAVVRHEYNDRQNHICYIDIDILGTAMEDVLYNPVSKPDKRKLNEIIRYDPSKDSFEDYKNSFEAKVNMVSTGKEQFEDVQFDVFLCSKESRQKKKFILNNGFSADVEAKLFNHYFKVFMDELIKKNNYNYVIFDMSPGFDSIVKGVLDYCCRFGKKRRVVNLIITTPDVAHVEANVDFLKDLLSELEEYDEKFGSVYMVVNDVFDNYNSDIEEDIKNYIKEKTSSLKKCEDIFKGCVRKRQNHEITRINLFRKKHGLLERLNGHTNLICYFDKDFVKDAGIRINNKERTGGNA